MRPRLIPMRLMCSRVGRPGLFRVLGKIVLGILGIRTPIPGNILGIKRNNWFIYFIVFLEKSSFQLFRITYLILKPKNTTSMSKRTSKTRMN
jgi:hypothetical protein